MAIKMLFFVILKVNNNMLLRIIKFVVMFMINIIKVNFVFYDIF
jgi:hypothetical protein